MRNGGQMGNSLLNRALTELGSRLPASWAVTCVGRRPHATAYQPDGILEFRGPDGKKARLVVEAKRTVNAAQAVAAVAQLDRLARELKTPGRLVVTTYLSPLARERLRSAGVSYLDLTGNARIELERPGLFIESRGADRDPAPEGRGVRSLKGGSAARIVRALCDWRPPVGVRELARRANANAGYATRVLSLLEQEDVVRRDTQGIVTTVNWPDLLRRWAQDYAVARTNRAAAYLDPRGIEALLQRVGKYRGKSAITGSQAIPAAAVTAPSRTASLYVETPEQAARDLGLRSVDAGANVLLLEPFDAVVWQRTREESGRICVAVSQCAEDLLTGSGREPSEGEALVSWMDQNERAWRA